MPPGRAIRYMYFVGFHNNPPSANVYRDDIIEGQHELTVGATVNIKPGRARVAESVVVVAIGAKGKLQELKVDKEGRVFKPTDPEPLYVVGTPYQEKLKQKASSGEVRRERHMQELADGLAHGVPTPDVPPVKRVCRAPKRLKQDDILILEDKLKNLPCWKKENGDIPLVNGSPVFRNGAALNFLKGDLRDRPVTLFRKIIDLCLGDLVGDPGLCATEAGARHRGKVSIPQPISQGAYGYCSLNCPAGKGFEPTYVLRTHITKSQERRKKKEARQAVDAQVVQEEVQGEQNEAIQEGHVEVQDEQVVNNREDFLAEDDYVPGLFPLGPVATQVKIVDGKSYAPI